MEKIFHLLCGVVVFNILRAVFFCPQGNRLRKNSSSSLQGWSSDAFASFWAGDLVLCSTLSVFLLLFVCCCFVVVVVVVVVFAFLFLFCFFRVCGLMSEVWRFGLFSLWRLFTTGIDLIRELACSLSFLLLLFCWFTFPFIRPSFLICYYISPGCMSILWTSWIRVWGWVSDRVITDPLFVCPMLCCVYFPMGERC